MGMAKLVVGHGQLTWFRSEIGVVNSRTWQIALLLGGGRGIFNLILGKLFVVLYVTQLARAAGFSSFFKRTFHPTRSLSQSMWLWKSFFYSISSLYWKRIMTLILVLFLLSFAFVLRCYFTSFCIMLDSQNLPYMQKLKCDGVCDHCYDFYLQTDQTTDLVCYWVFMLVLYWTSAQYISLYQLCTANLS